MKIYVITGHAKSGKTTFGNILKEKFADGAFAEEVINEVEGLTIASVRATLSSLATKGLVTKEKAEFDGKMKTKFTAIVNE